MKKVLMTLLSLTLVNAGIISGGIGTDFEVKNIISNNSKDIKNTEITHYIGGSLMFFDIVDVSGKVGYYYKGTIEKPILDKKNTGVELGINLGVAGRTAFKYNINNDEYSLRDNKEEVLFEDNLENSQEKNIQLVSFGYDKDTEIKNGNIRAKTGYSYILREEGSTFGPHLIDLGLGLNYKKEKFNFGIMLEASSILPKKEYYDNEEQKQLRKNSFIISPKAKIEFGAQLAKRVYLMTEIATSVRVPVEQGYDNNGKKLENGVKPIDYKVGFNTVVGYAITDKVNLISGVGFLGRFQDKKTYGLIIDPQINLEYNIISGLKAYAKAGAKTIFINKDFDKNQFNLEFRNTIPKFNTGIEFRF